MTRTTNARVAGFTYLFYTAIAICADLLMHHATSADGDAAKLARIGEYATAVRMAILLRLLECFSALVLAMTLYGITRDQDHGLAVLALVCRVAEGVLGSLGIPGYLGLLWLAKAGRDGCPGHPHDERAARGSVNAGPERSPQCDLLCRGEHDLFLAPPARTDGARLNRMAGPVRVGPARGGTSSAARRFLYRAADRILPVAAGAGIPSRARAMAAHQRCRRTGNAMRGIWSYRLRSLALDQLYRSTFSGSSHFGLGIAGGLNEAGGVAPARFLDLSDSSRSRTSRRTASCAACPDCSRSRSPRWESR